MTDGNIPDHIGFDQATMTAQLTHEWHGEVPVYLTIVKAIAAVTGTPAKDIQPVHSVIDPDALERIFDPPLEEDAHNNGQVSFTLEDYHVTVHASGDISIDFSDADPDVIHSRS